MNRRRCRCRCRCGRGCHCRPGAAGFGGRLGHCVLYSVGVLLGYRVLHDVDVLLGRHVKKDFVERYRHGAPVVAGVDGSDAVSRGSGTVHRKAERDGMMGLPNALYCDKVTSMIFSEEHIAHSSATALAKANAGIAVVLGSCAVMSQNLAQKCMSACAVMSEHLAQGCFGLAAVASQHWAQRSRCVAEFASITYRY